MTTSSVQIANPNWKTKYQPLRQKAKEQVVWATFLAFISSACVTLSIFSTYSQGDSSFSNDPQARYSKNLKEKILTAAASIALLFSIVRIISVLDTVDAMRKLLEKQSK